MGSRERARDGETQFIAVINPRLTPSDPRVAELAAVYPENPFVGPAYAEARRRLGERPVLLAEIRDDRITAGAIGFLTGRGLRWMEITSCPAPADAARFWTGVARFCRRQRVATLAVESFGSPSSVLPPWPATSRARTEWVLDLTSGVPDAQLASNHRRNVAKARKTGVVMTRTTSADAAEAHADLMRSSMQRRHERGEHVPTIAALELRTARAMLESGAGTLFQATRDGRVFSSLLVLSTADGAYYQTAGTSPEGMDSGTATFLVLETARALGAEGVRVFNLGGATDDNPGLKRFKSGFGAHPVTLEACEYEMLPPLLRKLRTAARLALRDRSKLLAAFFAVERFVVYAASPDEVLPSEPSDGRSLRPLSDAELLTLADANPEFADQASRFRRLGYNAAYAVELDGVVLHVAWMISAEQDRRSPERNVEVRDGEVEITHCYTATQARGAGAYPFAISELARVAARRGVRTVFMITNMNNTSSQRGIEKAGLRLCGRIWRVRLLQGRVSFVVRGHRLLRRAPARA